MKDRYANDRSLAAAKAIGKSPIFSSQPLKSANGHRLFCE